jgi:hypothetical protein
MMAFILMINFWTLAILLTFVSNLTIETSTFSRASLGLIVASFVVSVFVYFCRGQRYKSIISKYENESENAAKRGNKLVFAYVIGSFLLFFTAGFAGLG